MVEKKKICCVCSHELSIHFDEVTGWRCHALGQDGYQCECWLRKERYASIEGYDLFTRIEEMKEELSLGKGNFDVE